MPKLPQTKQSCPCCDYNNVVVNDDDNMVVDDVDNDIKDDIFVVDDVDNDIKDDIFVIDNDDDSDDVSCALTFTLIFLHFL